MDVTKKIVMVVLAMLVFLSSAAYADGSKVIPLDADIYDIIDMLYVESQRSLPSGSRPWSIDEWDMYMARMQPESLSTAGQRGYQYIISELAHERDYLFTFGDRSKMNIGAETAFEVYLHTNQDDFPDETDWVYGYTDRKSVMKLALELSLSGRFYLYGDLEYRKNRFGNDNDEADSSLLYNHFLTTNVFGLEHLDFETPYRAFVAVGGRDWNIAFGRDLMRWGHSRRSNLVIHNHLDFHDMLRFTSFHDRIKFEATYLFFNHAEYKDEGEKPPDGIKMFLGHRLEFRLFNWLSLAVTENVMYTEESPSNFMFFNPAYVFHNLNNKSLFNAIASAELDIAPSPWLNMYYQFVLDQARAPLEGYGQPDAMAHLGGYLTVFPIDEGYLYHQGEVAYTYPYMYLRDKVDFRVLRRQFVIGSKFHAFEQFLGHPHGGNTLSFWGNLGFSNMTDYNVQTYFEYVLNGAIGNEQDIDIDMNEDGFNTDLGPAPTGTVEHMMNIGLAGEMSFTRNLSAHLQLDVVRVTNKGNVISSPAWDVQVAAGIAASW